MKNNTKISDCQYNLFPAPSDSRRKKIDNLEKEVGKWCTEAGSNPGSMEALRAQVKYNRLKTKLEELILFDRTQNLPKELKGIIWNYIN